MGGRPYLKMYANTRAGPAGLSPGPQQTLNLARKPTQLSKRPSLDHGFLLRGFLSVQVQGGSDA